MCHVASEWVAIALPPPHNLAKRYAVYGRFPLGTYTAYVIHDHYCIIEHTAPT